MNGRQIHAKGHWPVMKNLCNLYEKSGEGKIPSFQVEEGEKSNFLIEISWLNWKSLIGKPFPLPLTKPWESCDVTHQGRIQPIRVEYWRIMVEYEPPFLIRFADSSKDGTIFPLSSSTFKKVSRKFYCN